MVGQIIGYVRVSSTDQNPARQIKAIGDVEETFTDHLSGASRAERTALATMLRHARRGDAVRVASMDLLGRSVVDLARVVVELTKRGCEGSSSLSGSPSPPVEDPFATFQPHLLGAVAIAAVSHPWWSQ